MTAQIANLVQIAREDNEYVGEQFLGWFLDEQREEVASMSTLLSVIDRAGVDNLLLVEDYLSRAAGGIADAPSSPDAARGRRRALARAVDAVGGAGESRQLQLDKGAPDLRCVEVRAAGELVGARRRVAEQLEQPRCRPLHRDLGRLQFEPEADEHVGGARQRRRAELQKVVRTDGEE